ncbi:amidase family protein [Pseudorhodoferax sp.]|uniref:amidase family protein n=1 Tax=Pseudorhodoferax sp. TaxID=1993553 RepID=UPI002DD66FA2|nr:amidase family protein [Pseudorhodoferax sp.]
MRDPARRHWLQAAGTLGALATLAPWPVAAQTPGPAMRVAALADEVAAGRRSALAVVEQALARAQAGNGEGPRCFSAVHADQARATARAIDGWRRAGRPLPPLAGVPVAVQDVLDEAGQRTQGSSAAAQHDAPSVRRLREAGLVLLGRTRGTDLAWPGLGLLAQGDTPRNRFERETGRVPGGGAAGAAIAVADGLVAAAIGNDAGGGLRVPAALNGLVGWKPTARRVPRDGMLPLAPTLDSIGVLAHSVDDCALLDGVLAGTAPGLAAGPLLRGLRVAVPTTLVQEGLAPEVAHAFQIAVARLAAAGVQVVELALPAFAQAASTDAAQLLAAEAHVAHRARLAGGQLDARVAAALQAGAATNDKQLAQLLARRDAFTAAVAGAASGFDALVWPSTQDTAPTLAQAAADGQGALRERALRNAALVNLFDGCALTLPCHAPGKAPVGLTLAGLAGSDARVLGVGRSVAALLASPA